MSPIPLLNYSSEKYPEDIVMPKVKGYKAVQFQALERDALVFETSLAPSLPYCPPDARRDKFPSLLVA